MDLDAEIARRQADQTRAAQQAAAAKVVTDRRWREAEARRDRAWADLQALAAECAARLSAAGVEPRDVVHEIPTRILERSRYEHRGEFAWGWVYGSYWGSSYAVCISTAGTLFVAKVKDDVFVWDSAGSETPFHDQDVKSRATMFDIQGGRIMALHQDPREATLYADAIEVVLDGVSRDLRMQSER